MNLAQKLRGQVDSRSMKGMLSRGKNVYPGGSHAAQKGKYAEIAKKRLAGK